MPALEADVLPEMAERTDPIGPPDSTTTSVTTPVVGIIYPPPEVRNIVDKTASFVARNGPEFEARIRQNELGNPKFNFLNMGDPYHAYYQHKVKDFREGKGQEPSSAGPPGTTLPIKTVAPITQQKQQELLKAASEQPFIPKDPPPEFEFIADPPSISALDLDVVKLTAQFAALNGRMFLTNLMTREQRNFQFDFLRPQHSLFQYFTKLLEQYTKVLIPPKDLMPRLKEECKAQNTILDQVKYRSEWIKYQEAQKRREEEEQERERVAYAQIDWHDFVVVETVDYQAMEVGNFPPPTTPDEVGARILMQERLEDGDDVEMQVSDDEDKDGKEMRRDRTRLRPPALSDDEDADEEEEVRRPSEKQRDDDARTKESRDNIQVQDMEEESSSSDEDEGPPGERKLPAGPPPPPPPPKEAPQPPPLPPLPDKVVVKKGYDPKQVVKVQRPPAPDEYLISPITHEKIPASKVQEHMRIGLLDPRWVEQRDKHIQDKMNQETVYAPGSAIEASLKQLAERRTDIFGVGDEETAIGKKIGEEDTRKDEKVTWDGHTSSVEAATRAARANITLEDQIHQIHKVKGLLPDEEKEKIGPKPIKGRERERERDRERERERERDREREREKERSRKQEAPKPPAAVAPPKPQQPPPPPPTGVAMPQMAPMAPMPPMAQMSSMAPMPPMASMGAMGGIPPPPGMMMMPGMPPRPMMVPQQNPFPVASPAAPMQRYMPPGTQMQQAQGGQMAMPMALPHPPPEQSSEDEPPSKKMRSEDALIPERQFLAKQKGPVSIKVAVPSLAEKVEWKLNGQILSMVLPLTDAVSAIKAKIHEETGLPPAKQKLHNEGLFFKDSNTLAFYNLMSGTVVQLQLKERGGRKK